MAKNRRRTRKKRTKRSRSQMTPIDVLPDDVLLAIFDSCVVQDIAQNLFLQTIFTRRTKEDIGAWQSLAHVCRRWRSLVLGSPRRLNLQLVCSTNTSARHMLDTWPALPIRILENECLTEGLDNIIALLKHRDRVCQINLMDVPSLPLEKVWAAMQEPFPELTHLLLWSYDSTVPVLSDSFLGGSAPLLQFLWLDRFPFPGLPKLLLSATHLVNLHLRDIPHSGYISPEAMVTALSTLTNFTSLWLTFQSPRSYPDQKSRHPPPLRRSVLPVLALLKFEGVSEYLEDLVARIDTPLLDYLDITFFNQIVFDTPQLPQFISRTHMSKALEKAHVVFGHGTARVHLSSRASDYAELNVGTLCRELDWQLSSLEQVCTSSLPPLPVLEDLYIHRASNWHPDWQDNNIENELWLELLYPFTGVKDLYLSEDVAPHIVSALKEPVGRGTTEVLPTLQNIWLEGLHPSEPVQKAIEQFVATRQGTNHPIAVTRWEGEPDDGYRITSFAMLSHNYFVSSIHLPPSSSGLKLGQTDMTSENEASRDLSYSLPPNLQHWDELPLAMTYGPPDDSHIFAHAGGQIMTSTAILYCILNRYQAFIKTEISEPHWRIYFSGMNVRLHPSVPSPTDATYDI